MLETPVIIDIVLNYITFSQYKPNYVNFKVVESKDLCNGNDFPVIAGGILNQLEKCYTCCDHV